jgi:hypothetical protein
MAIKKSRGTHNGNKVLMASSRMAASVGKNKIHEMAGRLKGPGGIPILESRRKRIQSWLQTLDKRGYLSSAFLSNGQEVRSTFIETFPRPATRAQFLRTILQFISAFTEEEFKNDFPNLNRGRVVEELRSIAADANRENLHLQTLTTHAVTNAPNAPTLN